MQADASTVAQIFDTPIQYRVPLYQRPYVWKRDIEDPSEDRLEPFWLDVQSTVDRYLRRQALLEGGADAHELAAFNDHFFGAVVLDARENTFGSQIVHQEVIDGQQRLTTAQLMIAAAERLAAAHGFATTVSALRDLRINGEKYEPAPADLQKLFPTNINRTAYNAVMAADQAQGTAPDSSNRIHETYEYFSGELEAWFQGIPEHERERYIRALHTVLRSHLKFVVITLGEGDNAQEIFESLNAQGTPLLAIDLIKNYVFRRAAAPQTGIDLDDLDEKTWRELDDAWWRQEQRQGRFKRPRAELFLMHWLTVVKHDEVAATGLFVEFTRTALPESTPPGEVRGFVERFIADAKLYRSLTNQPDGSVARRFLDRLDLMDTTTLYPLILRLFMAQRDGQLTPEQRDQSLRALESWIVRRMICDYTTKNYNRFSVDLLADLDADIQSADQIITNRLLGGDADTDIWPDDAQVSLTLVNEPLYNRLKPVRRVRMILEACEIERRTASGGYAEIEEHDAPQLSMSLQIEHVLPQKWRDHWPVDPELDDEQRTEAEAERELHVNRLGNLTLLTSKLNPSVSNGPWPAKRAKLDEHSVLHLNRDLVTGHETEWIETDIDARGAQLASVLCRHWPRLNVVAGQPATGQVEAGASSAA